jgi:phospholipid transport system substrate-binding protein
MSGLRRRGLLALALLSGGVAPLAARAADPDAVAAPIRALDDGLTAVMQAGRSTPFVQRYQRLAPVIDQALDLPDILRVSVGPAWPTLGDASQATLSDVFRRFTVASYVANFASYGGEHFEILPELRPLGDDQVVQTRLIPASGGPIRIDYVMRQTGSGWKAVDVLLDGTISRVAVQRSDFRGVLGQGGAAQLIDSLQRKVSDLSGGSLAS